MAVVSINGVAVDAAGFPTPEAAAVHELLSQRATATGLIAAGVAREAVDAAIARLLEREAPERFEALARDCSNCPSAQLGGNLGQIQRGDTVPEFERALFDGEWTGISSRLVKTRYGFHIVAVDRRVSGSQVAFEGVRATIAERLRERVQKRALEQYVRVLAGRADVRGVDLGAAAT